MPSSLRARPLAVDAARLMEEDPLAELFGRACSLRPTQRVEERLLAACAVVRGPQLVDDRGAARALGEIRVCQGELRSWAREDRRRGVDACLPLMAAAATDFADALHRRKFPRCGVARCRDCAAHRGAVRRGLPEVDWAQWTVAAADARLAELDAVCADKAAVWARPDAEDVVSAALAWFSWPTVWAQPVEDDAEAARLLRVADNAEAPAVELWRQLHNYRFPFCSGGAACAVHRETPVCGFVDPRAAAQAQSWEATPPPPPPPPPTPEQPAGRVSPERPGATSPPLAALRL